MSDLSATEIMRRVPLDETLLRQRLFEQVLKSLAVHAPELPESRRIAIATDVGLFGKERGAG